MMDSLAPSVGIGLGGCGNKCKALLLDEADAYITTGLSYWDVCACEPLVRARGGFITIGNAKKLSYPLGKHHIEGLHATKSIGMRDLMRRRAGQDINVAEFLSVIVYLAEKSGDIIRKVEASGEKQISMKDKEGPVTIADI